MIQIQALAAPAHNCIRQSSGQARYRRSTAGYKVREKTKAEPLEQLRSHLRLLQLRSTATMNRRSTMTNLRLATFQTQRSNFDAAIKLAFTGFLRTAELTCEPKNLESDSLRAHKTSTTRCHIQSRTTTSIPRFYSARASQTMTTQASKSWSQIGVKTHARYQHYAL
jgi:hypothetical protein